MPDGTHFLLFGTAALVLLLVPGPVVLYTIARSVNQGRRAGLLSVLAAGLGDLCHVLAASLGLSAILLTSATAFSVVKYAGAAYLVYLGVRTLAGPQAQEASSLQVFAPSRIFWQGLVVSVLNPKTALFFLAFLPQFVEPGRSGIALQIVTLGALFVLMGIFTNGLYAVAAAAASSWFSGNAAFQRGQQYFTGSVYIALGVGPALAHGHSSE